MLNRRTIGIAALAVMSGLALTMWLQAAPVLDKRRIPDEVRSLAGLNKFRIQVDPIVGLSEREAPPATDIAKILGEQLTQAGFEIGDEPHLPRLVLQIMVATDPDQPEAVGLGMVLAVHQEAYFKRLDHTLTVPTTSMSSSRLTVRKRAKATIRDMTRRIGLNMAGALRLAKASRPAARDAGDR